MLGVSASRAGWAAGRAVFLRAERLPLAVLGGDGARLHGEGMAKVQSSVKPKSRKCRTCRRKFTPPPELPDKWTCSTGCAVVYARLPGHR